MPPTRRDHGDNRGVDIHELLRHHPHHLVTGANQHHSNASVLSIPLAPTTEFRETLEEEADHLLIFLTILLPLLIGVSAIAGVALLVRKMRRSESEGEVNTPSDLSFSSLPYPKSWENDGFHTSFKISQTESVGVPHFLVLDGPLHSTSLPHLLAIETYYNYPSAASILDETFHDVVDQNKIQAGVMNDELPFPSRPRSITQSISMKRFRRLRIRIFHFLNFSKRRREAVRAREADNNFNLTELPTETREQLKQIYVY